jgi:hypothetical protein
MCSRWPTAAKHWQRRRRALRASGEAMPTIVQVPPPWAVMRLAVRMGAAEATKIPPHRWIGARLDWLFSRPSELLHRSATARFLIEAIAALAILIGIAAAVMTAIQLQIDLEEREEDRSNREEDRINNAWSLVASAVQVQGNVGLIEALQSLNARHIDMSRLQMPNAYLFKVRLESARLNQANLSGADLSGADLSRADLSRADLSRANLSRANLANVILSGANLSRADLADANLSRADLTDANLAEAKLPSHKLITNDNTLCRTIMPSGIKNFRDCEPGGTRPGN